MKSINILTIGIIGLASCGLGPPRFSVMVNSIADPSVQQRMSYVLYSGDEDVAETSLEFREYASYVHRGLQESGYVLAADSSKAETAVFLTYGIGDPKTKAYTYSVPTWGQTGVSSSNTYGTVSAYGGYGTYSGTTTYTPSYGITGYSSHVGYSTTYFRFAEVTAFDVPTFTGPESPPAWKTTIESVGSSGDLRRVFPIMVGAATQYFGGNTGQIVEISLREGDDRVRLIKGELDSPEADS